MTQIKNDDIENIVKEIRKLIGNLQIVVLNMPEIDQKNPTNHEQKIIKHHSNSDDMIISLKKTSQIPEEFQLPGFNYNAQQLIEILSPPEQIMIDKERLVLSDKFGEYVNIENGSRHTKNELATSEDELTKKSIVFVGGCRFYGIGCEDDATIESYLQDFINTKAKPQYRNYVVKNYGQLYGGGGKKYCLLPHIKYLITEEKQIKEDDILIIGGNFNPALRRPNKFHFIESQKYFSYPNNHPYKYGEVFIEEKLPHLNKNGNKLIAEILFDFINSKNLLTSEKPKNPNHPKMIDQNNDSEVVKAHPVLQDAIFMKQLEEFQEYLKSFKVVNLEGMKPKFGKNGGICMNANPFTNGHRYLVETAASQVDHLYVLVAEENITMFPFKTRFHLIKEGTKDIPNVTVIAGGMFVGSVITFPEYYDREVKKEMKILPSLDLLIFANCICPVLDISVRFVGTEPICPITSQFNVQLKDILPKKNIELIELQRKEIVHDNENKVVSASYVREILKKWQAGDYSDSRDLERLQSLVPPATYKFIETEYGSIFPPK